MKRLWTVVGIATLVAVLGVAVVGAVAWAQDDGDGPFDSRARVREAIANALGISVEEYDAAVDTARDQVLDEAVAEGVLTQEQADAIQERQELGFGRGMMGRRGGFGRGLMGSAMFSGTENSLIAMAAEQLDMTVDELVAALQDGETTIADLAAAQGVDPQAIVDAYIAGRQEFLAEAVADGRITQEQADLMLEHMEEMALARVNGTFPSGAPGGCPGGRQGGFRRGGMMGPGRFLNPTVPGSSDL